MRSQRREGKDHAVEAGDERSVERGPGPGPDIGSTKKIGDVIPASETMRDGDRGDIITAAAPTARMTETVGEVAALTRTVMAVGLRELTGSSRSSRRLSSPPSIR